MTTQIVPASTQSDGRWRITQVDTSADPLSVADLLIGNALTYSFTPDGFNWTRTQATVEDKRLTLVQDLSRPGKVTETLEVKYVASESPDSADAILVAGSEGFLNVRRGIDEAIEPTTGQKADVITYVAGVKRPDAPTENGLDTVSQTLYITAPTITGGVLTA